MYSIKRVLLFSILLLIFIINGLAAYFSYQDARHEVDELFDAQLAQSAKVLRWILSKEIRNRVNAEQPALIYKGWEEMHGEKSAFGHKYENKIAFQVWSKLGGLIVRSESAPGIELGNTEEGFSEIMIDSHQWHVFSVFDEQNQVWLEIAEQDDIRSELSNKIAVSVVSPILLMLPVLSVLILLIVNWAFRPLQSLSDDIKTRGSENLAPLLENGLSKEVLPIAQALNQMFQKIKLSFENEKRFIAKASHELRTPLTVIKLHTQNAQFAESDDARKASLNKVVSGIERSERLVQQMLDQSKIDGLRPELTHFDLLSLCQNQLADLALLALENEQSLSFEYDERQVFEVESNELFVEMILRNLVDNAIRYAGSKAEIRVCLRREQKGILIEIQDNGPGIKAELLAEIGEAFSKGEGENHEGAGLGLYIVKNACELLDIEFLMKAQEGHGFNASLLIKNDGRLDHELS